MLPDNCFGPFPSVGAAFEDFETRLINAARKGFDPRAPRLTYVRHDREFMPIAHVTVSAKWVTVVYHDPSAKYGRVRKYVRDSYRALKIQHAVLLRGWVPEHDARGFYVDNPEIITHTYRVWNI